MVDPARPEVLPAHGTCGLRTDGRRCRAHRSAVHRPAWDRRVAGRDACSVMTADPISRGSTSRPNALRTGRAFRRRCGGCGTRRCVTARSGRRRGGGGDGGRTGGGGSGGGGSGGAVGGGGGTGKGPAGQ